MITWDIDLETGYDLVDDQHKKIFDLINKILESDSISNKKKMEKHIKTTLDFLVSYAIEHFAAEESLMVSSDYPQYKQHKKMHDDFVTNLGELLGGHKDDIGIVAANDVINNFILKWLESHILGADKHMVIHYRQWRYPEENN